MNLLKKGAEADIYETKEGILKQRVSKGYRAKQLDEHIRKIRTRAEANILEKAKKAGANVPELINSDDKTFQLVIKKIHGTTAKDFLNIKNFQSLAKSIGEQVKLLHEADIVHGDLTTSNIMVDNGKVFIIDFGLSRISSKTEDKAVDLHTMEETLASTHREFADKMIQIILKEYKSKDVLQRLDKLREKGRYKKH